jgi:hypothetical protein
MKEGSDPKRDMLRHTLATLAYRGGKTLRNSPEEFPAARIADTTRAPIEILAHIGDLLEWALWLAKGEHVWTESTPQSWDEEVRRFFEALTALDAYIASPAPLGSTPEKIFQGPIADALTHIGQIAMLRRAAGSPVKGENYFRADILAGHVGPEQSPPRREFD